MRKLITGALGHIGSRLIRELPVRWPDAEILFVDNMLTQRYPSLFDLPGGARFHFFELDVTQSDLAQIVKGCDAVVHLAAMTDAANSFSNKAELEENNFQASARVAEVCRDHGVHLIHLSSTSVYGVAEGVVTEESLVTPQSPYAETKLKEEALLSGMPDLRFLTFRFGTVAGISSGMRFHTAVNKFCWLAVMGQPITVWRTAMDQCRPYLDLGDAVGAIFFALETRLCDRRIYNVVTQNMTVGAVTKLIKAEIPDLSIEYVDTEIMNQLSYEVSGARLKASGFTPSGSIGQCIADTICLLRRARSGSQQAGLS